MKIAHFSDAYLPNVNGVTFYVDTYATEQSKKNEVKIFAPAYSKGKVLERKGRLEIRRYYSFPIPTYKDAHLTVPDFLDIYRTVHDFSPDIIHFHSPGSMGLIGILMAKILKIPLVGTYHTLFSEMVDYVSFRKIADKYLVAIDKAAEGVGLDLGILRNGEVHNENESAAQKITWSLVNRVYKYADKIICPTEAIERELLKRRVNKNKLEVISNGIDNSKFSCKNSYKVTNKILHVGRLGFEKNTDEIIKAFHKLINSDKNYSKLVLVIAGDGPARKELEKLTSELAIKNRVRFLGMVKRDKLPGIYKDADFFVTASDMETLGLVVLEAMASGLPIIGVDKYALTDLIENNKNGFKVNPGDIDSMEEMMKKLVDDPEMRTRMGKRSREVSFTHDIKQMYQKLDELYQRIGLKSELAELKKVKRI